MDLEYKKRTFDSFTSQFLSLNNITNFHVPKRNGNIKPFVDIKKLDVVLCPLAETIYVSFS